jgi:RNA-directed DNA polymerase
MNLSLTIPVLHTEGKTDRKHIEAALRNLKSQGLFLNLNLEFSERERTGADANHEWLISMKDRSEPNNRLHIFIFDRDKQDILNKIKGTEEFRPWGNNVYSFAIPVPKHRDNVQKICIEFYYSDSDIVRHDENGRRLFVSTEFNPTTGAHLSDAGLKCNNLNILGTGEPKVVFDEIGVFDETGANVALSKNNFADSILNESKNFQGIDFSGFKSLFERIQIIINEFDGEHN